MLWLFLAAGVVAILRATMETASATVPRDVTPKKSATTIGAEFDAIDKHDPAALMALAQTAQEAGHAETAKALAATAVDVAEVLQAVDEVKETPLKSPIKDVPDDKWTAFTAKFRGNDVAEISPAFCLGIFNIGFLRLRELGLTSEVKQGTHDGRTVWKGTLKPPITVKRFLSDPVLQYKVFTKDMAERAEYIRANYSQLLGTDLEGTKATLSGLLAVIKLAGTKGFHGWASDPRQRVKFKNTTAAFLAANGIF